jgi:hypothetical protein
LGAGERNGEMYSAGYPEARPLKRGSEAEVEGARRCMVYLNVVGSQTATQMGFRRRLVLPFR